MDKEWENKLRFYKGEKCKVCRKPITIKNKSGYCREHRLPASEDTKRKISIANTGKNNGMWKENGVSLTGLHAWAERHKIKPKFCEECHKRKPIDLANISQEYHRDVNDFRWLCRHCHMLSDGRLNNLKQYAKKDN